MESGSWVGRYIQEGIVFQWAGAKLLSMRGFSNSWIGFLSVWLLTVCAHAQNPSYGSPAALKGSYQRVVEATYYDAVFPIIAFVLVIILPTCVAVWVIIKSFQQRKAEMDAARAYINNMNNEGQDV